MIECHKMMSIEIKVNGKRIGYAEVINRGSPNQEEDENDLRKYHIKYSSEKGKFETYVEHHRKDGAEKLAEIVFQKIQEL